MGNSSEGCEVERRWQEGVWPDNVAPLGNGIGDSLLFECHSSEAGQDGAEPPVRYKPARKYAHRVGESVSSSIGRLGTGVKRVMGATHSAL